MHLEDLACWQKPIQWHRVIHPRLTGKSKQIKSERDISARNMRQTQIDRNWPDETALITLFIFLFNL